MYGFGIQTSNVVENTDVGLQHKSVCECSETGGLTQWLYLPEEKKARDRMLALYLYCIE